MAQIDVEYFSFLNHSCYGYFTYNDANMRVGKFTVVNNTDLTCNIYVHYNKTEIIYSNSIPSHTTESENIPGFYISFTEQGELDYPEGYGLASKIG